MSERDVLMNTFLEWSEIFMHRSMRRFMHFTRNSGLSLSMVGALFHLNQREKAGVTELGDHLGVTSAAASQMLERLVQQDLIQRDEDPDDRRVKQIIITEKGCKMLEEGLKARQGWLTELVDSLSETEQEQVSIALSLLIQKANQTE